MNEPHELLIKVRPTTYLMGVSWIWDHCFQRFSDAWVNGSENDILALEN